jgi:glycosyltransferase involved in cell wall biosynthesis
MKSKKNILIISPSKIGLTETFIRSHITNLDAQVFYLYGWELDFKTELDIPLRELYKPAVGLSDRLLSLLPHALYFRIMHSRRKYFTREALIKRYIQEHQIDLILAEYGTSGSFIAPICVALNIPFLVHFHGIDASSYDYLRRFEGGYKFMFRHAKKIIAVSQAMAKALEQAGCPPENITVNTYGPHAEYTSVQADYDSDVLISVGRHTYKKAPYLTILAFQKVLRKYPKLKLKMIGTGELFDVSFNMVKSLGLENQILLLGGLARSEIIPHLSTAFLFVQHSLVAYNGDSEGTPVGIIEAMAAGLPIVSTRHAGIPDVVVEGETGLLVDENDVDGMADSMIQIIEDRESARRMGQNGKKRILENYSMEKHISKLNQLIYE